MAANRPTEGGSPSKDPKRAVKIRAGITAAAAVAAALTQIEVSKKHLEKPEDPASAKRAKEQGARRVTSIGLEGNLVAEKKGGDGLVFNPGSIAAPVNLEIRSERMERHTVKVRLPFEYARAFDKGSLRDPKDVERAEAFLRAELQERLGTALVGLDMSKGAHRALHDDALPEGMRVTEMQVTGISSPEGPASEGPRTLDKVDPKNLELSLIRAGIAGRLTMEVLDDLGIRNGLETPPPSPPTKVERDANGTPAEPDTVPTERVRAGLGLASLQETRDALDLYRARAEEAQFSPEELASLSHLASGYPGNDATERVFNLIVDYNRGSLDARAVSAAFNLVHDRDTAAALVRDVMRQLDGIVASKRAVEITLELEGAKPTKVLIPIPLLLLALPWIARSMAPVADDEEDREERTGIDDLGVYFDREQRPDTLSYRRIVGWMGGEYDGIVAREGENAHRVMREMLCDRILRDWTANDNLLRAEHGHAPTLDHSANPVQREWAWEHADMLLSVVEWKHRMPELDERDILDDYVIMPLRARRSIRQFIEASDAFDERRAEYEQLRKDAA